jgi:hypothetical protein
VTRAALPASAKGYGASAEALRAKAERVAQALGRC